VKIRIKDNSIRLRLTRGEIDLIRDKGVVRASTRFPGSRQFSYSVESCPASINPAAFYSESEISVRLPETVVLAWAKTEQVSIEGEQVLDGGDKLKILVEKDFSCLAPRNGEDESDMFAHPEQDSKNC
jgi:hypothetical protein